MKRIYFRNLEKALNIVRISHGALTVAKLRLWDCPCKQEDISDIRTYKPNTT